MFVHSDSSSETMARADQVRSVDDYLAPPRPSRFGGQPRSLQDDICEIAYCVARGNFPADFVSAAIRGLSAGWRALSRAGVARAVLSARVRPHESAGPERAPFVVPRVRFSRLVFVPTSRQDRRGPRLSSRSGQIVCSSRPLSTGRLGRASRVQPVRRQLSRAHRLLAIVAVDGKPFPAKSVLPLRVGRFFPPIMSESVRTIWVFAPPSCPPSSHVVYSFACRCTSLTCHRGGL
jgi:hypothetical protein